MPNHLIIGLGGTGGKIIRSLRKTIFQEYRSNESKDENIGYLYLDTSDEMMGSDSPSWSVLGSSTQLDESSKVHILPLGLQEVLKNINQYPGIKDWIGDTDLWNEFLGGATGLRTAGGQRRRLGRFILACNIEKFNNALVTQVGELQKSAATDVNFHICCGLGGGTGSGVLIDVLAQIRKKYVPTGKINYRIVLYLFLPERIPLPKWDASYYHANGYAALMELNAYEVGSYEPIDISLKSNTQNKRISLNGVDKFAGSYVFSNVNENGTQLDTELEIPEMIADFIFQKNIAAKDDKWLKEINFLENNENTIPPIEKSSNSKYPERSLRFLTFGVKRIAIPEQEIREYIMYNYASQAALQLRYNNWNDETGFRNTSGYLNLAEYFAKGVYEKWKITDEHFQLSLPIINDNISKKWKTIGDTWRVLIPEFKTTVKGVRGANWIVELKKLCEQSFTENYRNLGVRNFYSAKKNEKKELAKEIVTNIEKDLFEDWRNGIKSIFDIKQLLEELIKNLRTRYSLIPDKKTKTKDNQERVQNIILANERTWANVGLGAEFLGKKNRLLDAQATNLEELYIYKTQEEAINYSETLMIETIEQLEYLKTQVETANTKLNDSLSEFDKNISQRCTDDDDGKEEEYFKQQVIRFYDPDRVRIITRRFIRDKKEQDSQTSNVRKVLIDLLGSEPTFKKFNERISKSALVSVLESTSDANIKNAEASLDADDRLFNMTIIDKLRDKYEGNFDELTKYVKKLIDFSGCYLDFDQNEINKSGDGVKEPPTKIKTLAILIPDFEKSKNDKNSFVSTLIEAFKAKVPDGVSPLFFNNPKNNEVVILNLINGFPLRYSGLTNFLKRKYEERLEKEDGEIAKMFLHSEGNGENLPKLFIPTQKEIKEELETLRQKAIPLILLADAMGLLEEKTDANGYTKLAFVEKDDFGDIVPVFFLDEKLSESYKAIDIEKFKKLESAVIPRFDNEIRNKSLKSKLDIAIKESVRKIKKERADDENDGIYIRNKEEAIKIINK